VTSVIAVARMENDGAAIIAVTDRRVASWRAAFAVALAIGDVLAELVRAWSSKHSEKPSGP
jgi:hypothetical protein